MAAVAAGGAADGGGFRFYVERAFAADSERSTDRSDLDARAGRADVVDRAFRELDARRTSAEDAVFQRQVNAGQGDDRSLRNREGLRPGAFQYIPVLRDESARDGRQVDGTVQLDFLRIDVPAFQEERCDRALIGQGTGRRDNLVAHRFTLGRIQRRDKSAGGAVGHQVHRPGDRIAEKRCALHQEGLSFRVFGRNRNAGRCDGIAPPVHDGDLEDGKRGGKADSLALERHISAFQVNGKDLALRRAVTVFAEKVLEFPFLVLQGELVAGGDEDQLARAQVAHIDLS